jgi:lipopolysaccharide biosynthesis glycosyltransferase
MINIMFCGNKKVYDGLLIAIISIVKHTKEPLSIYLITANLQKLNDDFVPLGEGERKRIEMIVKNANSNSSVKLIDISEMFEKEMLDGTNMTTRYTPYIFLRLFADEITELPDKILYLDADLVIYDDIKKLYDIDVEKYDFAAVKDYFGKWFIDYKYMNSGVLLMNLKRMRETGALAECRKMCKEKKMLLPDQTALNVKCKSKLYLPRKFNEQKNRRKDTVIRHFSMTIKFFPKFYTLNIKPWHIDKIHDVYKINDFDDVLEEYLKIKGEEIA